MTNRFKNLDTLFPCCPNRHSGEVVSVTLTVSVHGRQVGQMYWKRKAWYVNSSVNAWHLHRGLCAEFKSDYSRLLRGQQSLREINRLLGKAVVESYVRNYVTDHQYHGYHLEIGDTCPVLSFEPSDELDLAQNPWSDELNVQTILDSMPLVFKGMREAYWKTLTS